MATTSTPELAGILRDLGVEVTREGREISGRCPVHAEVTGHPDRSPSWSMNAVTGLWICYSCGSRGTLQSLVSRITGDPESPLMVAKFIGDAAYRRAMTPAEQQVVKPPPRADVETFRQFQPVPAKWLRKRGLDPDVCHTHGVRFDPEDRAWILPIISPLGDLMGWQAKKVGWFMNVPPEINKSETLFGLPQFKLGGTGVLLESPLDVVRLASVMEGVQGLASFGVHVSVVQIRLLLGYCDRVVIGLDHDKAGTTEAKRLFTSMPTPRRGIAYLKYSHTEAKDIGDMTDDEIEEAVVGASSIPWWVHR